jgi:hypothetical protein
MPLAEPAPTQVGAAQKGKRAAKGKRKQSTARPVGDYGLTDRNVSEERAMERAHTGEAI